MVIIECHSEEPFVYAQGKLRDEESRFERLFALLRVTNSDGNDAKGCQYSH